jgi:hypothetical protein
MRTHSESDLLVIHDPVMQLCCVLDKFWSICGYLGLCGDTRGGEWHLCSRAIKLILESWWLICFLEQRRDLYRLSCNSLFNVVILCLTVVHLSRLRRCVALELASAIWLGRATCILAVYWNVVLVHLCLHWLLVKLSASVIQTVVVLPNAGITWLNLALNRHACWI